MNIYKLLIVAAIMLLAGCDNLNEKKVAYRNIQQKPYQSKTDLRSQPGDRDVKATSSPLAHYIAQADSMVVISCYPETPIPLFKDDSHLKRKKRLHPKLTSYVAYTTNKQKDLDELADAVAYNTMEPCDGICFDKQWSAYYVELFKNGELIDNTHFYTVANTGYNKSGFNFYFVDVEKVHEFFNSRNVFPMPRGCFAGENRRPRFKREKSEK